jgi:hypothetical protein
MLIWHPAAENACRLYGLQLATDGRFCGGTDVYGVDLLLEKGTVEVGGEKREFDIEGKRETK